MAEKKQKKSKYTVRRNLFIYIVLGLGAFISLIPFVWMISTSLMSLGEALGTEFFPSELHFENYVEAWRKADFSEYFINSILITIITLTGQITFSTLAAYAFARIEFPGRDLIFSVLAEHDDDPGDGLYNSKLPDGDLAGPDHIDPLDQ